MLSRSWKEFLHRKVWQHLPKAWRRSVLFQITSLTAPRPTARAQPSEPVVVAGVLRTASGLGQSARLCHDALEASGIPVRGIDLTTALMQPLDKVDFVLDSTRSVEGPGTIILHVNAPLVPLAMLRMGSRTVSGKYIIGYWAWELPQVPSEWMHGVPFVHEIWVLSEFTAEAVKPIAGGRPVRVVPPPVALNPPAVARGERSAPFTVLTVFNMASSFARKNPCAAIEAFRLAFGEDPAARLVVKTANSSEFPRGLSQMEEAKGSATNITIIDETMSASQMAALYDSADVLLSLHRSEGFGLTLAEAMLRGVPVVATNWSGNTDFLTPETGVPVGYTLVPAEDPQGTYHHPGMMWAEPDVQEAADALRQLRADAKRRDEIGRRAAEFARRHWDVQAYGRLVRQHLGIG